MIFEHSSKFRLPVPISEYQQIIQRFAQSKNPYLSGHGTTITTDISKRYPYDKYDTWGT
jgi:hypothetical protein